jgi:hypothetical protein
VSRYRKGLKAFESEGSFRRLKWKENQKRAVTLPKLNVGIKKKIHTLGMEFFFFQKTIITITD